MKTAMQQLLDQMREERTKLPLPIEWDRCYQAIEMMIQNTYMQIEKEQIVKACDSHFDYNKWPHELMPTLGEQYYNEQYGK